MVKCQTASGVLTITGLSSMTTSVCARVCTEWWVSCLVPGGGQELFVRMQLCGGDHCGGSLANMLH